MTSLFPRLAALLLAVLLAACSSNPYAVKPNPVPGVKATLKVERLWIRRAGVGLDDTVGNRLRPAVADGRVFAADVHGRVTAFDTTHGKRQWQVKTGLRIAGGLWAGFDTVLFGTRDGEAVALSATDGHQLWKRELSSEILSSPASNGDVAIFQSQDGQITALDLASGKTAWNYTVSVPNLILRGGATPLLAGDLVYVGLASGKVLALGVSDGSLLWETQVANATGRSDLDRLVDIDNNLILDQGGLFAATYQGKVVVMDAQQGRLFWGQDISTHLPMSQRAGSLFIATDSGGVRAVNEQDGATLWQQDLLRGRGLKGTDIQSGQVVTGDSEGWLYWLDPLNGDLHARRHAAKGFAGMPVVDDGVLYVQAANGRLSAWRVRPKQ